MKCLKIFNILVLSSLVGAQSFCSTSEHSGESVKVNKSEKGKVGNVEYELWHDGGDNSATFYSDGSFSCSFQDAKDYSCYSGITYDTLKKNSEIGHLYADFKAVKNETELIDYSFVGVSGTGMGSVQTIEFFIVDNWLSEERPGDWVGEEKYGDFMIDGAMYSVFVHKRNAFYFPGEEPKQYFSIRKEARDCGTIDITAHITQWEKLGMKINSIKSVKVFSDAGSVEKSCSGSIDFPYAKIYTDSDEDSTTTTLTSTTTTQEPEATSDSSCPKVIVDQGYRCCSPNCTVIYSDEDGDWGVENGEWCGCGNGNAIDTTATATTTTTTTTSTTTTETMSNPKVDSFCSSSDHSGKSVVANGYEIGKIGKVDYELWYDGGDNSGTFYDDGSFSCSFENTTDSICYSGITYDTPKSQEQIGHIYADFKLAKKETKGVKYSLVGAYGRNGRGNIRFYIVDNWLSEERPGDWIAFEKHGDYMIDGAMYTVYENPPYGIAMVGYESRDFFSIRKEARDCGTINVTAHLEQWEKLGMSVGEIREIKVFSEAGNNENGCSGSVDFPYAKVYTNSDEDSISNDPSCSKAIVDQGYRCCSANCTVFYSNEDGDWGVENGEWCGCGNGDDTDTTETVDSFCSIDDHSGESIEVNKIEKGKVGSVDYELWYNRGNNSATFYSDGSFSCSFQDTSDYMCLSGITYDEPKSPKDIGHVYADFKLVKKETEHIDYSYIGVYGIHKKDRGSIEFYIVDNWLSQFRPGDWVGNKKHGEFMIDGAMYTVYENTRYGIYTLEDTPKQFFKYS